MKVLFIDDDFNRAQIAKNYYKEADIFLHSVDIPDDFIEFDLISFDNDLGNNKEVITKLRKLAWTNPPDLTGKIVIVHSMNPIAAIKIADICRDFGAIVKIIPFSTFLVDNFLAP